MTPTDKRITDEELAAAVEALRQRSTPDKRAAVEHALRSMGIDPASMASLNLTKPETTGGDNDESN